MPRSTGANGSVASPSRLSDTAVLTRPAIAGGEHGFAPVRYGSVGAKFYDRIQAALPDDTGPTRPRFYQVDKGFEFPNIAGIKMGQNPVSYNPMLSRAVQTDGQPSAGLTFDDKRYPNASWRHEFHQWAQRFPVGPAAPGMGRLAYNNRYYPGNMPTQITGYAITGNAVAGQGNAPRSNAPRFVVKGGRGMRARYQNRLTRLAAPISYSSTTMTIGESLFTQGPLGTGGISGG